MKRLFALILLFPFAAFAQTSPPTPLIPGHQSIVTNACMKFDPKLVETLGDTSADLSFRVTAEGNVTAVAVTKSSGNAVLDANAVACAGTWHWAPAMENGKPVEMPSAVTIFWKTNGFTIVDNTSPQPQITPPAAVGPPHACNGYYPQEAIDAHVSGKTVVAFKVTTQGTVTDIVVAETSGSSALDNASTACVETWQYSPAMQNGEPVEIRKKAMIVWLTGNVTIVRNHPAYLQASSRSAESCFADYPPKAREAGIEGTTTLRYAISKDGDVKDVRVEKSSGNDELDAAAVKCSIKLRYEPAYKDDWPIETALLRNVVWKLDVKGRKLQFAQPPISCARFYPVKPEQLAGIDGTTELTFTIDKGEASDVSVTHSSGNDDLDWAAIRCIKTWRFEQATVGGKPITVPGHAKIAWKDALLPPK